MLYQNDRTFVLFGLPLGLNPTHMSTAEVKLQLFRLIDNTNDVSILNKIRSYFNTIAKTKEADWWDELNGGERLAIEESIAEIERGEVVSHEHVMKESKKILNRHKK